jgi:hypothetical protein
MEHWISVNSEVPADRNMIVVGILGSEKNVVW